MTTTQLLERCCREPGEHLALESYSQFQSYIWGYKSHGRSTDDTISQADFLAALRDDYGIHDLPSHVAPWSVLTAIHGPEKGLRKHLEYRQRLAQPTAPGEGLFF